jgi:hypothetical protein
MMDFDDELDGVLVDQALNFDAMKEEFEGNLAEMKKLMEEEIETVKKESEMEILEKNVRSLSAVGPGGKQRTYGWSEKTCGSWNW